MLVRLRIAHIIAAADVEGDAVLAVCIFAATSLAFLFKGDLRVNSFLIDASFSLNIFRFAKSRIAQIQMDERFRHKGTVRMFFLQKDCLVPMLNYSA